MSHSMRPDEEEFCSGPVLWLMVGPSYVSLQEGARLGGPISGGRSQQRGGLPLLLFSWGVLCGGGKLRSPTHCHSLGQ